MTRLVRFALQFTLSVALLASGTTSIAGRNADIALESVLNRPYGRLLTAPGRTVDREVARVHSVTQEIVDKLLRGNPRRDEFHWIVEILDDSEPLAAASLSTPALDAAFDRKARALYGIRDQKPLAFIQITPAFFELIETRSEYAFVLNHEIRHHLNGDTDEGGQSTSGRAAMQAAESAADKGSVHGLAGRFRVEASYSALAKLIAAAHTDDVTTDDPERQRSILNRAASADHHYPSLRLAQNQADIQDAIQANSAHRDLADSALPPEFKSIARRYAGRMPPHTTRRLANLVRNIARERLDPLSAPAAALLLTFYKDNSRFWRFSDNPKRMIQALEALARATDRDVAAHTFLGFLLRDPEREVWSQKESFARLTEAAKSRLASILGGLSQAAANRLSPDDRRTFFHRLETLDGLRDVVGSLARTSPVWQNLQRGAHLQAATSTQIEFIHLNFPKPDSLKGEWATGSALALMERVSQLSDPEFAKLRADLQIPALLASLLDPKAESALRARYGPDRFDSLIARLTNALDVGYDASRSQALSPHSTSDQRVTFLATWLQRASIRPELNISHDFDAFLTVLTNQGLGLGGTMEYTVKSNWQQLNELLLKRVLLDATLATEKNWPLCFV